MIRYPDKCGIVAQLDLGVRLRPGRPEVSNPPPVAPEKPGTHCVPGFLLGARRGLEQGGSAAVGSRATKAPAGLWLARGGQRHGMSTREDADDTPCTWFFVRCAKRTRTGRLCGRRSRATKAPAGLWLARDGQPQGMSTREDADRYQLCTWFFCRCARGFEQGGSAAVRQQSNQKPMWGCGLARGGQPQGMSNKREDADRYTFVYLLFFLGAPGGFEQGGSDDIGVRATETCLRGFG